MRPKQITLKASLQLKASRGVSAKAALNMPGPTGFPIFVNIKILLGSSTGSFKLIDDEKT